MTLTEILAILFLMPIWCLTAYLGADWVTSKNPFLIFIGAFLLWFSWIYILISMLCLSVATFQFILDLS